MPVTRTALSKKWVEGRHDTHCYDTHPFPPPPPQLLQLLPAGHKDRERLQELVKEVGGAQIKEETKVWRGRVWRGEGVEREGGERGGWEGVEREVWRGEGVEREGGERGGWEGVKREGGEVWRGEGGEVWRGRVWRGEGGERERGGWGKER